MLWKVVTLVGLALCAQGNSHATSQQKVKQEFNVHHGELHHMGSHVPEHHEEYAWAYPSYEFSYSVNDPHTKDYKGQYEHRKGDEVKGEYWLLQPDGKKRTVKYHADKHIGFKADVHYSEQHEHQHHAEPNREDIIIPVVEIVEEEPPRKVEESEVIIEESPEVVVEERSEEHIEPTQHKPIHQKPIHIEYYVNHKYRKHHSEKQKEHKEHKPEHTEAAPEAERREEEGREEESAEEGQEARIREDEAPRKEIKHRKPVHIEYYSKIHHPIHNEHHGHEEPKHIVFHHELREERRDQEEQHDREQNRREEKRVHEEKHGREEKVSGERGREEKGREEQRGREEERELNEVHSWGHKLPPLFRPLNIGYHDLHDHKEERREPELHTHIQGEEVRVEKKHDPHVQLLRMHKPVVVRPEHARYPVYHRDHRRQSKTQ